MADEASRSVEAGPAKPVVIVGSSWPLAGGSATPVFLTNIFDFDISVVAGPQSVGSVFAGPVSGGSGSAVFRDLVASDLYNAGVPTGVYHASAYGAIGDGVISDSVALEAAVAAAVAAGGGTVFLKPGTYVLTRSLYLSSNVALVGSGRATILTKPATVSSLVTVNAVVGATTVTVANGALFSIGQGVHAYDTSSQDWTATPTTISGIAGNVLTFAIPLNGSLQTARTAAVATSFPLLRNIQTSVNIRVTNLILDGNRTASDPIGQFVIALIHWVETYTSMVRECWFRSGATDGYSDQANNGLTVPLSQANVKATRNIIVNCWIDDCAYYGVHLGTCMEGAIVQNNIITNCGNTGVHYSAYAQNTICMGNIISACKNGIGELDERDIGNIIVGNTIKSSVNWGITSNSSGGVTGGFWVIEGNRISDCPSGGMLIAIPDNIINGNIIKHGTGGGNPGISLTTLADRNIISNNIIEGGSSATGIFIDSCDDLRILGNNIRSVAMGMDIRGATNLIISNNTIIGSTTATVRFQVAASTDIILNNNNFPGSTPISQIVAVVRLVQNGMGTNGSTDPASGGDWNTVPAGTRFNGRMVRWDNGSGVNTISVRWDNAWMKIATL